MQNKMKPPPCARITLSFESENLSLLSFARQSAKQQDSTLSRYFRELIRKDMNQQYFEAARPPVGLLTMDSE
jgi:hypothetical protein